MGYKRVVVCVLILICLLSPLWASSHSDASVTSYVVVDYEFAVDGKTWPSALRREIIPSQPVTFSSEEEMGYWLNAKRQQLINKRIFDSVEFTHERVSIENGVASYRAKFSIKDAGTLLALPYPKYSTDDGLRFGVKLYDKNLFGSFTDLYAVFHTSQNKNRESFWDWKNRQDFFELVLSDLYIGSVSLDITSRFWPGDEFYVKSAVNGIKINETQLSIAPWMKMRKGKGPSLERWDVTEVGLNSNVGTFLLSDKPHSISSYVKVFSSEVPHLLDKIETTNTISRHGVSLGSLPLSFNTSIVANGQIKPELAPNKVEITFTGGTSIRLPFSMWLSPSLGYAIRFEGPGLQRLLKLNNHISVGSINWEGDYRRGFSTTLTLGGEYFLQKDPKVEHWYSGTVSTEWFMIWGKYFNPSLRLKAYASNVKNKSFPTDDADADVGAYMRGIRYDEGKKYNGVEKAIVANFNLTTRFINLGSFARTYAIPFVDVGIFSNATGGYDKELTVGMEGVGIMTRYPGYPIRLSVGINGKDLVQVVKKTKDFGDVRYEISFGMGYFF